ncbi:MAG: glycosyl hydrolase [Acidobacteriota bacterium]|nr:glycosyl hydrolase [Acidobacteriota bacterium]
MLRRLLTHVCAAGFLLGLLSACDNRPVVSSAETARRDLESGFRTPPDEARPWVYWFIMDGNSSREGITADLEAMQKAGIGGAILLEVDVGIPRGPVAFMSPAWRALFKHAVAETERLGLAITLNAGPGWTGSGGPWVEPGESMQHLVASAAEAEGPARLDIVLERPKPRPRYFGGQVPEALDKARESFYADVAVLAVPSVPADSRISDIDEKALFLRHPYSSMPKVKPFLPAPAAFPAAKAASVVERSRIHDLTGRMDANGRLAWDAPAGKWTILRFCRVSTGANTRPAPLPGLGLECDKFDPAALDAHYRDYIGALLAEIGPRPAGRRTGWTMLHIDSWEMGAQNWSGAFREEFRRRRGYDILPFLPVMTGRIVDSPETSERFLWDLRRTAQELIVGNHARRLKELGRQDGFGLSIEPYDMNPCADLTLGAEADVPMGEFWSRGYGFDTAYSCFEAVSIAHTNGRPVTAAESFTADDKEAWRLHPAAMKDQADWAFATGINRLVVHRYAHQPWLDRAPGMTMGPYGVHYERTQTWWDMSRDWNRYLARCQFLLRRGLPVADILYLAPEGAPQVFVPPPSALRGPKPVQDRREYNFDGCAPETLLSRAAVKGNRIVFPDGMSYAALVLPERETMTPALLGKIRDLAEAGATIIGPRPSAGLGLKGYPESEDEVRRLAGAIWGDKASAADGKPMGRRIGRGLVFETPKPAPNPAADESIPQYSDYELAAGVLAGRGIPADFESESGFRYAHRRDGETDVYFVSNPAEAAREGDCLFRTAGKTASLWEPVSGRILAASPAEERSGRTRISLKLGAHDSVFVVFQPASGASKTEKPEPMAESAPAAEIGGPWRVRFTPGRGAPESLLLPALLDLSEHPAEGVRHFSGTAVYETEFEGPVSSARVVLDLGRIEVMARVRLNGRELGVLWRPPFRIDAGGAVRPGRNKLEVEVANLWLNRLIGDAARPANERPARTTWNPFEAETPLPSSGLIGPVRLLVVENR